MYTLKLNVEKSRENQRPSRDMTAKFNSNIFTQNSKEVQQKQAEINYKYSLSVKKYSPLLWDALGCLLLAFSTFKDQNALNVHKFFRTAAI
jgi:hypothetical protein